MLKIKNVTVAALFSLGLIGIAPHPLEAQEGVLFKQRAGDSNYCHLKFPAIRGDTLNWDRPVLQNPNTSDIVDFYGPCDYNPIGEDAVRSQSRDKWFEIVRDE